MPNCFQLFPKGSDKAAILQTVDDEMRKHFGAPEDNEHWFNGWYNYIGFMLAMGKTWEWLDHDIMGECLCCEMKSQEFKHWSLNYDILVWLRENYTSDAWYELK